MDYAVIIPARFDATRLPGKPLLDETGRPLIAHVAANAMRAPGVGEVIVATDHHGVAEAARAAGARAIMTRSEHASGTERVAEAAGHVAADVVVNVQGDEPELDPEVIGATARALAESGAFAATAAARFADRSGPGGPADPHAVKAYLGDDRGGWRPAHWFTRAAPYRDRGEAGPAYLHLGLYAFRKDGLSRFAAWSRGPIERFENLEQLRILERGEKMAAVLASAARPGIDTPEDYAAFVTRFKGG